MLYDFVSSNYPITIVIVLLVGAWVLRNRSSMRLALLEDRRPWNWVAVVAAVSTVALVLWATVLDNWRQLLGYLIQPGRRWMADPMEAAITSDALRNVTLALLAVSLVTMAIVYARHRGPYVFLLLSVVFLPVYAFVFNHIRIRADVFLRQGERSLQSPELVDTGFILFWTTGLMVIIASVVIATYLVLFALVALPVRLIYGYLASVHEPDSPRIFDSYREHADRVRGEPQPGQDAASLNHDATPG